MVAAIEGQGNTGSPAAATAPPARAQGDKAAIVFLGTLSGSWALTVLLRRIPFVARMI